MAHVVRGAFAMALKGSSKKLVAAFSTCVHRLGKHPTASLQDAVFGISVPGKARANEQLLFVLFGATSGQSGAHPAMQTFVRLRCIDGAPCHPFRNCRLEFCVCDFVAPEKDWRPPLGRQHVGAFDIYGEDELAAEILASFASDAVASHCLVHRVTIQRLQYTDIDLDDVDHRCG